jgi:hypothetical protein
VDETWHGFRYAGIRVTPNGYRPARSRAYIYPAAELPALGGTGDFQAIRGAEKILGDGEDWRVLGTDTDPTVKRR